MIGTAKAIWCQPDETLDALSRVLTHLWLAPEHFTFTRAVKTAIETKRAPTCRAGSMGGGAAVGLG